MGINFSFQTTFTLKNRRVLKQWIKNTIEANNKEMGDISYIFCSDDQLLDINKEFLNHDYYTDVITFDYSETENVSGDIFISIDRIRDNAKILELSYLDELHRVIIHGVLHLLGFKDKTKEESKNMRRLEDECLSELLTLLNKK
jgi:rRNA maturation RNase YbeY